MRVDASGRTSTVGCECGCGFQLTPEDQYGRKRRYISGHNTEKKYEDPTQYKREWNYRNRKARFQYKQKFIRLRKVKLIKLKGSKCCDCGLEYDGTNARVFQFHHRNSKKKVLPLNLNFLNHVSMRDILREVKKCDLKCANCHALSHGSEY